MTRSNRILALVLLLGSGTSLSAQSQDSSFEKSMVQVSPPRVPGRPFEAIKALAINEDGLILTTWRNVCVQGEYSSTLGGIYATGNVRLIGVHPTRDLALLQVDLSKTNPQNVPKAAKLAKSPVSMGDQIFLYQYVQPIPAIVCSETEPVDNPECFWMTARDARAGAPWPNGTQPYPENWVTNLQGEVQGVVARVLVNGKLCLRVIPIHDVKPEQFVPLAKRRPNFQKAQSLIQIADELERDLQKNRFRPIPFGSYEGNVQDYLRLALAEDPTNKDLNFRLGVVRSDSKANAAPEARGLPDPTVGKTSEQVNDEFTQVRLGLAMDHLKAGRLKVAQGILEDIVASSPKTEAAKMAQRLLDSLKDPKK